MCKYGKLLSEPQACDSVLRYISPGKAIPVLGAVALAMPAV